MWIRRVRLGPLLVALGPGVLQCASERDFRDGAGAGGASGAAGGGASGTAGRSAGGKAGSGDTGRGGEATAGVGAAGSSAGASPGGGPGRGGAANGAGEAGEGGSPGSAGTGGPRGGSGGKASGSAGEGGDGGQSAGDPCEGDPCANGGSCIPDGEAFDCECAGAFVGPRCEDPRFEWLGVDRSSVYGISDDGRTIVGSIPGVSRNRPARWTRETGFVALESLSVPVDQGMATAASADGSVIVGQANLPTNGGAFRWTTSEGLVGLGLGDVSVAQGVSANGVVIVGRMYGPETEPLMHLFRWTAATGVEDVATLGVGGEVTDINGDGTAVVGGYSLGPFRWTQTPGLVQLGSSSGQAEAISFDGATIAGNGGDPRRPFVYANAAGYEELPLEAVTNAQLTAMSGNGELFAGSSSEGVWLWDAENGTRMFVETFEALEADLTGWTSMSVYAISRDGSVLAGDGYRDGVYNTWLARL